MNQATMKYEEPTQDEAKDKVEEVATESQPEEQSTELVSIESTDLVSLFSEGGVDPLLDEIEKQAKSVVHDVTTEKGRKAIASMAYKVSQTKVTLDKAGEKLKEEAQKTVNTVNTERKKIRDRLDALRDKVRKPLTDFQENEKKRVAEHEENLKKIEQLTVFDQPNITAKEIIARQKQAEDFENKNWEEFLEKAQQINSIVGAKLISMLTEAQRLEKEKEELEKLRQDKIERDRKDAHEDALQKMSGMISMVEGEVSAAKIAGNKSGLLAIHDSRDWEDFSERADELLKSLIQKLDSMYQVQHKKEQDEIRQQEKDKADKIRKDAHSSTLSRLVEKTVDEGATSVSIASSIAEVKTIYNRDWEEFSDQAKEAFDRIIDSLNGLYEVKVREEEQAEKDRIKKQSDDAVAAEQKRQKDQQDKADAEQKKREEDKNHRAKINNEAMAAIKKAGAILDADERAKAIVTAIIENKIPHVKIEY